MDKPMYLEFPRDDKVLAEIGKITLRHNHLDYMLKMLIKTFTDVTIDEVVNATKYEGSRTLRERIKKLGKARLGEGKALILLQSLMEKCGRATDKRNELVHSIWAYELDGEHHIQQADNTWKPSPKIEELTSLLQDLQSLISEISFARIEGGFIFTGLTESKTRLVIAK